jgi:hypothetical protein
MMHMYCQYILHDEAIKKLHLCGASKISLETLRCAQGDNQCGCCAIIRRSLPNGMLRDRCAQGDNQHEILPSPPLHGLNPWCFGDLRPPLVWRASRILLDQPLVRIRGRNWWHTLFARKPCRCWNVYLVTNL